MDSGHHHGAVGFHLLAGRCRTALLLLAVSAVPTHGEDAAQFLALIKARDAQFDNAQLTYTMMGTNKEKDYSWMEVPVPGQPVPERAPGPLVEDVAFRYVDQMTVRGAEITFHRLQNPDDISDKRPWTSMTWNNLDGVRTELVRYDEAHSSDKAKVTYEKHKGLIADGEAEHRMCIEFALGFGFAKRITEVQSLERTETGYALRGTIKLWNKDVSQCELELDEAYVVRSAVIDADVSGNLTHIEVDTSGSIEKEGFVFANSGQYRRRWDGRIVNGERVGTPRTQHEYEIRFEDARFGLTDEEYKALSSIEVPLGTLVVDPDGMAAAKLNVMKSAEDLERAWSRRVVWLVNAIGLTALLVVWWLRARRRQADAR